MRRLSFAAAVAALGAWTSPPAAAFEAEEGARIARTWCAECHQIEPGGRANELAPAFEEIANDPARTSERLRTWLADPHPPMPNLSLTRQEIDAVVAYLRTLKHD